METSGVGRQEAVDSGTETGNAQVGGGPRAGAVSVVGASVWDGGEGAETGGRRRL